MIGSFFIRLATSRTVAVDSRLVCAPMQQSGHGGLSGPRSMTKVPAQPGISKHRATERTIHLGKHRATERTIHLGFCWRLIYFVIGKMSRLHDLFRFNDDIA